MGGVLTRLFATHANILASVRSTEPRDSTSVLNRMLLYRSLINQRARIFGNILSPDTFSARGNLISELLRYL